MKYNLRYSVKKKIYNLKINLLNVPGELSRKFIKKSHKHAIYMELVMCCKCQNVGIFVYKSLGIWYYNISHIQKKNIFLTLLILYIQIAYPWLFNGKVFWGRYVWSNKSLIINNLPLKWNCV